MTRVVNGVHHTTLSDAMFGRNCLCFTLSFLDYDDDRPFIVLTETKFSFRCIPVWIGTLLPGLGSEKETHVIMFSP